MNRASGVKDRFPAYPYSGLFVGESQDASRIFVVDDVLGECLDDRYSDSEAATKDRWLRFKGCTNTPPPVNAATVLYLWPRGICRAATVEMTGRVRGAISEVCPLPLLASCPSQVPPNRSRAARWTNWWSGREEFAGIYTRLPWRSVP